MGANICIMPPSNSSVTRCHCISSSYKLSFVFAATIVLLLLLPPSHAFTCRPCPSCSVFSRPVETALRLSDDKSVWINLDGNDDDEKEQQIQDEDDDKEIIPDDPYQQVAPSEFTTRGKSSTNNNSTQLARLQDNDLSTKMDWGGALGQLRERVEDIQSGQSGNPSIALYRLLKAQPPSQAIGNFVKTAKPQVVQAMSGAVGSLLGGLSSPESGVETIVRATGDKIGNLCFTLQMTGYMFRNAEYVLALKDLMKIKGSASWREYREAFDRLDGDGSGYIEASEVRQLLDDVYDGKTPRFEIDAFIKFFDKDDDGRISWEEFERGLGAAMASQAPSTATSAPATDDTDDEVVTLQDPEVIGTVQIEMDDGTIVQVDAREYIESLKKEAADLKAAIQKEKGLDRAPADTLADFLRGQSRDPAIDEFGGIAGYIARRQGDVKSLTEGISPEIVETMQMLVDFVLEGGGGPTEDIPREEMEIEMPGAALRQLALWQLVLGYQLREAEAKGDYLKLLE